tara:strand:+ start:968 stop:1144 length:177 start_codon:yes stop_codon:yes gene_type:complete
MDLGVKAAHPFLVLVVLGGTLSMRHLSALLPFRQAQVVGVLVTIAQHLMQLGAMALTV